MYEYANWFAWMRAKQSWAAIVVAPFPLGTTPNIPMTLQPGELWSGLARYDDALPHRIRRGRLYVVILASHSNKPAMKRVHIPAKPPVGAEQA
jgi:hypothetical protein